MDMAVNRTHSTNMAQQVQGKTAIVTGAGSGKYFT